MRRTGSQGRAPARQGCEQNIPQVPRHRSLCVDQKRGRLQRGSNSRKTDARVVGAISGIALPLVLRCSLLSQINGVLCSEKDHRGRKGAPMTRLSLKQVCELTGWTERHVRRVADRDKWQMQISESRGRNGKPEREYLLTSLPADTQALFMQKSSSLGVSETAIARQSETLPLFPASPEIP